jgi:hypothetical protein
MLKFTFHFLSRSIDICESMIKSVHYFIQSHNFFLLYYLYVQQLSWLINTFCCHSSLLVDCLIEKKKYKKKKENEKETLPKVYICSYTFSFKVYTMLVGHASSLKLPFFFQLTLIYTMITMFIRLITFNFYLCNELSRLDALHR